MTLASFVALSAAASSVTTGSVCECGGLTNRNSDTCQDAAFAWTTPVDLATTALVHSVVFDQLTDEDSDEFDMVARFFCANDAEHVPTSVQGDEPFYSFKFSVDSADDNTCVTAPLPAPLVVPAACALVVELKAEGPANAVALTTSCGDVPLGATSHSFLSCSYIPYPVPLTSYSADVVIGVECKLSIKHCCCYKCSYFRTDRVISPLTHNIKYSDADSARA